MNSVRKSPALDVGDMCRAQEAAGKLLSHEALTAEIRAALSVIAKKTAQGQVRRAAAQKVIGLMKVELCDQWGAGDSEALLRYSLQSTWEDLSRQELVTGELVEDRFAKGESQEVTPLIASLYRTRNGVEQRPVNTSPLVSATRSERCFSQSMDELRGLMGGARERRLATRDLDDILTSR